MEKFVKIVVDSDVEVDWLVRYSSYALNTDTMEFENVSYVTAGSVILLWGDEGGISRNVVADYMLYDSCHRLVGCVFWKRPLGGFAHCLDCELYNVETHGGEKYVHIDGYCYDNGDGGHTLLQGVGCYVSVSLMMDGSASWADEFEDVKKCVCEVSADDVATLYKHAVPLPIDSVNLDTPDGLYVNLLKDV